MHSEQHELYDSENLDYGDRSLSDMGTPRRKLSLH